MAHGREFHIHDESDTETEPEGHIEDIDAAFAQVLGRQMTHVQIRVGQSAFHPASFPASEKHTWLFQHHSCENKYEKGWLCLLAPPTQFHRQVVREATRCFTQPEWPPVTVVLEGRRWIYNVTDPMVPMVRVVNREGKCLDVPEELLTWLPEPPVVTEMQIWAAAHHYRLACTGNSSDGDKGYLTLWPGCHVLIMKVQDLRWAFVRRHGTDEAVDGQMEGWIHTAALGTIVR